MGSTHADAAVAANFRPRDIDEDSSISHSPVVDMAKRQDAASWVSSATNAEKYILAGFSLDGLSVTSADGAQKSVAFAESGEANREGDKGGDNSGKEGENPGQESGSETVGADGTKVRTGAGGVIVEYPDGKTETTDPEGRVTTEYPKEVRNKDGTLTKHYPYDGRQETSEYDEDDPREKDTEYPNGRKETEFKDGHKVTNFESSDPEKRESETVSKDGHVTTTKYRDGHTEQIDDRTGDVVKSYPPKDGKPGYNVTIHKGQDGNTSVETGTYEELKPVK